MPDRAAVRRAVSLFRSQADYVYFFGKLTSPGWIEPLVEEGRFETPPAAVREGDFIRFPGWPELEYLSRVAGKAPEAAARVLIAIPQTDNQRVHLDLVEVARQLSPSDAAKWARRESEWVAAQQWLALLLPEKLGQLVAHLATNGQVQEALELSRALFTVLPDPRSETEEGENRRYFHPQPRGRMDGWEYGEAIQKVVPALAEHGGIEVLELFVGLLAEAIRLSSASDERKPPVDYSFIWRSTIEEQDEHGTDVRDILVDAVRDVSVALARRTGCESVSSALLGGQWDIFRRVALHTIRLSCLEEREIVRGALLKPGAFTDSAIHPEYVLLLRDAFAALAPEDQATILGWIEKGPDRETMRERHKNQTGQPPTNDEVEAWVEHWQRDRLSPLRDVLPREWRTRFNELVDRHGAPEFDLVQYRTSGGWVSERSPITGDQLASFSAEERRRFLREWVPPEGFDQPTRRGVVQTLEALGEEFFVAEADHALAWSELHPAYIASLLGGLDKAVKAGAPFSWPPVLDLCLAVVTEPATDWDTRWAKMSVAQLLTSACDNEAGVLPQTLRERVSDVIVRLLEGELGAREERVSPEADYLTAAINSISGKALEAAIRAAVWAKRGEVGEEGGDEWRLADRMQGIASILDRVVRPESGFALDARAIFGLQLGPLLWLDREWVTQQREHLFTTTEGQEDYRRAVWNTFLTYGRPYTSVLKLFADQYAWSIDNLQAEGSDEGRRRELAFHLAEHVMTYYWQGSLPLGERKGLVRRFFKCAGSETRGYALEFVGRSLRNSGEVPAEPLQLLRDLIAWRISVVRQIAVPEAKVRAVAELREYGWWFASGKFQPAWALGTLLEILRMKAGVEPDHLVAQELVRLAEDFPVQVAEILRLMIELSRLEFTVSGWRDEARQLLAILGRMDKSEVRAMVSATVDTLLARGYLEYRELMPR